MDTLIEINGELEYADSVPYSSILSGDYLAHYGVKGMKWGRRKSSGRPKRESRRAKKKRINRDLSNMSDQELQNRLNRLRNEDAYRQLNGVGAKKQSGLSRKLQEKGQEAAARAIMNPVNLATAAASAYAVKKIVQPTIKTVAAGYTLKKNLNL